MEQRNNEQGTGNIEVKGEQGILRLRSVQVPNKEVKVRSEITSAEYFYLQFENQNSPLFLNNSYFDHEIFPKRGDGGELYWSKEPRIKNIEQGTGNIEVKGEHGILRLRSVQVPNKEVKVRSASLHYSKLVAELKKS